MTNLERWQLFMKDIPSPNSFINMGFYFMIAAALQRRVWLGSPILHPIFPNLYLVFVGDPGIGKGLVLIPVKEYLRFFKRGTTPEFNAAVSSRDLQSVQDFIEANTYEKKKDAEEKLLIPDGADSTTYEALVRRHGRTVTVFDTKQKTDMSPHGIYTHASMYVALEEMSSLFKKHNENVTNYLIRAFDCSDYIYETKHQGTDILRKPCLAMLAGTTPAFMQECFDARLIGDGFSSRCVFIFEASNRFNRFEFVHPNEEQLQAKKDLLLHVKKLTTLFGQVSYTEEAKEYFRDYFENKAPYKRENTNEKLIPYYARKNVHAQKLAMAIHFSDSTDMTISLPSCILSLNILRAIEKRMHYALQFKGANPLTIGAKRIMRFLKIANEPKSFIEIWQEVGDDVDEQGLHQNLRYLHQTGQIIEVVVENAEGKKIVKFDLKHKENGETGEAKE